MSEYVNNEPEWKLFFILVSIAKCDYLKHVVSYPFLNSWYFICNYTCIIHELLFRLAEQ